MCLHKIHSLHGEGAEGLMSNASCCMDRMPGQTMRGARLDCNIPYSVRTERVQPPIVPVVLTAGDATNFSRCSTSLPLQLRCFVGHLLHASCSA